MKILFDENIPEGLDGLFVGHHCNHVTRNGWSGITNGNLLKIAEAEGFDLFITFDKGIPYQHKVGGRKLAIFVLQPRGQGVAAVQRLMPEILIRLSVLKEGEITIISNRK